MFWCVFVVHCVRVLGCIPVILCVCVCVCACMKYKNERIPPSNYDYNGYFTNITNTKIDDVSAFWAVIKSR